MRIVIDIREQSLYEKCQELLSRQTFVFKIVLVQKELSIGDILIQTYDEQDILLIERKSFSDLVASIKDGRYEEQSHRLLNTSELPPHSIIYLLEGMFSQVFNPKDKQMIYSAMTTLQYFKGYSIHRTSNTNETAEWLLFMAAKLEKELEKGKYPYYYSGPFLKMFRRSEASKPLFISTGDSVERFNNFTFKPSNDNATTVENTIVEPTEENVNYCNFVKKVKKDNITPENIGEIMLCQIPGISSVTAIAVMKQYKTIPNLIEEVKKTPTGIDTVMCETKGKFRKISKSCAENIRKYLCKIET
jgi:ERCC4-type nuclease